MNAKALFAGFFVLAGLFGTASPALSQQSPPASEKANRIVALVDKAAALIDSQGKAVFPEFRESGSEWMFGDTYLFVYDLNSNVLLNAAFPKREGTNTTGVTVQAEAGWREGAGSRDGAGTPCSAAMQACVT